MLIGMRDKNEKLVVKDMLDIDFDMSVEGDKKEFYVRINSSYRLDEIFETEESAEDQIISILKARNALENELREY